MPRILLVTQEKGGVGKSVIARALAEMVPDAPVIEIDASQRLIELKQRVTFFPMRADFAAIERTGGKASRAEFDGFFAAMMNATAPTIVDVGANTSASLLGSIGTDIADALADAGIELGVLVIVTAEPGALAEAPRLLALATPFVKGRFLVENRLRGEVDGKTIAGIADGAVVTTLAEQVMEDAAVTILQAGGFVTVPKLDPAKLIEKHGVGPGTRIRRDLTKFRLEAMEAVKPAAAWLIGEDADAG